MYPRALSRSFTESPGLRERDSRRRKMAYSVTLLKPVPSIARWAFSYSGFGMLKVTYSSLERDALSLDGLFRNAARSQSLTWALFIIETTARCSLHCEIGPALRTRS